ncbi:MULTISPECIES: CsgG/HfaB family protein [Rhodobacterales]|jgi:curli production assembly/transport component CsgG|uniref:Curlin n=2 Tax=Phaeobacter gallaeciensis TaxID=60890 RepID=A0A1B0ZPW1_9RHOB|nr:CsgG/HfaB family protein [Phaeobacter gallaeciensis]MDF1772149.1 CsgG/HfaB family protein [Pseudophaeobacter sp. bin_em_oilr2.035]MEE2817952.1 CsgG/HfaB family protein [Pseudomonadota bacterium]PVZ46712.1 curlin [Phaeobacter sp. JL2872]ANP36205.1 hypothetical protein JL2886_01286 [Phaeobacter gallaeciensis]MDE4097329.1 CsgG/HfaB family protein [Phaeobacter gallaeciensis]
MVFGKEAGLRVLLRAMVVAGTAALSGCATTPGPFFGTTDPTIVQPTPVNMSLRTLPEPTRRISVSVYDFPDLTGQYKERELVQTLSRAVSQGGSAVLIKALQDAGERRWFTVLDRAGLQDLVRERQILTEMRRQYRGETEIDPNALAPLLHSGIILQGGIVGYDSNTQTGGAGARYLGIGGNTEWQLDTVTVSLRAVSTETGEVLTSVVTQKSIGSSLIRGSVFRYIALDELLEIEAGVTGNEPRLIALQQAIEKAVYGTIIEGAEVGLWAFKDKGSQQRLIAKYRQEKLGEYLGQTLPPVRPVTISAARITQTRPKPRPTPPAPSVRQLPPAVDEGGPVTPPPPADGEVIG